MAKQRTAPAAPPMVPKSPSLIVAEGIEALKQDISALPPEKQEAARHAALRVIGIFAFSWEDHVKAALPKLPTDLLGQKIQEMRNAITSL